MSDLISRRAVLKHIEKIRYAAQMMDDTRRASILMNGMHLCEEAVRNQTSAEPQIIRCKDCKWWDKKEGSRFGYCHAIKHGYYTGHWEISIHRKYEENFYCADAERREHE